MDILTTAILSGVVYDLLKHQLTLTSENIKLRLKDWLITDSQGEIISTELNNIELSDKMSEKLLSNKIASSQAIISTLKQVKQKINNTNIQNHSGSGDNVAGNKNVF